MENFGKIFLANETSVSPGMSQWLAGIQYQASAYAMGQCLATLRDGDLRSDLQKIKIPMEIFHGRMDKICSFDLALQMQSLVPHAVLVPFEKSGHALFVEEAEKFNSELIRFAKK